jgi:hypothetical protein
LLLGADAVRLDAKTDWSSPHYIFDLEPTRLRLGFQGKFFGLELHAYDKVDDIQDYLGIGCKLEIEESYGAYLRMQDRWVFFREGVTWFDTRFTAFPLGVTNRDVIAMPTYAVGLEIPLGPFLAINVDYTYADGRARYPDITVLGPGLTDPTLRIQGAAAGITLRF